MAFLATVFFLNANAQRLKKATEKQKQQRFTLWSVILRR